MSALLDPATYVEHLTADLTAIVTLDVPPTTPVPNCPGWTVDELAGHLAGVCDWAAANLAAPPHGDFARMEARPQGPGLAALRDAGDRLLATIADTDPTEHRPNWGGDDTALFWWRRLAVETALHRVDAATAAGDGVPVATTVDTALAADGIEEFGDVFLLRAKRRGIVGEGETVHLHATDTDEVAGTTGEWMYTFGPEEVTVTHEHGKGDMAVRGSASDLLLFVWNRRPTEVQCFGDPDPLTWWPDHVRI